MKILKSLVFNWINLNNFCPLKVVGRCSETHLYKLICPIISRDTESKQGCYIWPFYLYFYDLVLLGTHIYKRYKWSNCIWSNCLYTFNDYSVLTGCRSLPVWWRHINASVSGVSSARFMLHPHLTPTCLPDGRHVCYRGRSQPRTTHGVPAAGRAEGLHSRDLTTGDI